MQALVSGCGLGQAGRARACETCRADTWAPTGHLYKLTSKFSPEHLPLRAEEGSCSFLGCSPNWHGTGNFRMVHSLSGCCPAFPSAREFCRAGLSREHSGLFYLHLSVATMKPSLSNFDPHFLQGQDSNLLASGNNLSPTKTPCPLVLVWSPLGQR